VASGESQVVNVDEQQTWPPDLRRLVAEIAKATPQSPYIGDLQIPDSADDQVRAALDGHVLLTYHATRLLDHERQMIKAEGLRLFSESLFEDKIEAAYREGAVTAEEHDLLKQSHMYATGEAQSRGRREGQVSLFLGRQTMIDEVSGLQNLMVMWGGEGISFSRRHKEVEPLLRRLGTPSIIVAAVPIRPTWRGQLCSPDLAKIFVGATRGFETTGEILHES